MFTLLCILAIIYGVLKFLNLRDEFRRRDAARAEREAEAAAMEEAMEEAAEEEEIRNNAVDVEAEIVDDAVEFDVADADFVEIPDVEIRKEEVEVY